MAPLETLTGDACTIVASFLLLRCVIAAGNCSRLCRALFDADRAWRSCSIQWLQLRHISAVPIAERVLALCVEEQWYDMSIEASFINACWRGWLSKAEWAAPLILPHRLNAGVAFAGACSGGHLSIVKWLITRKPEYPGLLIWLSLDSAFVNACCNGHYELANWILPLVRARREALLRSAAVRAAAAGHIHVVKWLVEEHGVRIRPVLMATCERGHLKIVQWLVTRQDHIWFADRTIRLRALRVAFAHNRTAVVRCLAMRFDLSSHRLPGGAKGAYATATRQRRAALAQWVLDHSPAHWTAGDRWAT